jgi:hypothetical protein
VDQHRIDRGEGQDWQNQHHKIPFAMRLARCVLPTAKRPLLVRRTIAIVDIHSKRAPQKGFGGNHGPDDKSFLR